MEAEKEEQPKANSHRARVNAVQERRQLAIRQLIISRLSSQIVLGVEIQGAAAHRPWVCLVLLPTLPLLIWCP